MVGMTNPSATGPRHTVPFSRLSAAHCLAVAACVTACGAPASVDQTVGTDELELGETSCGRDPVAGDLRLRADGQFVLSPGVQGVIGDALRTPNTYNDPTCFLAAKLAIDGGVGPDQPIIISGQERDPVHIWVAPASLPTNSTDCAATSARAILYAHSTIFGPEQNIPVIDAHSRAHWEAGLNVCEIPWMDLGHPTGGSGIPYSVAVTARINNEVTRSVLVVATTRTLPPDDRGLCGRLGNCIRPRN